MKIFPNLSFPLQIKNNFGNIRLWVHTSPCEQGIILFDVDQLSLEGVVVGSSYMKLLPENIENLTFFGNERKIINIPQGSISNMEVVTGANDQGELCVQIRLTFEDESEYVIPWITE